jgi:hypothetical protein
MPFTLLKKVPEVSEEYLKQQVGVLLRALVLPNVQRNQQEESQKGLLRMLGVLHRQVSKEPEEPCKWLS